MVLRNIFNVIEIEISQTRKCGLCEWETPDITNKTGCFEKHINNSHKITLEDYLLKFKRISFTTQTILKV